MRCLLTFCEAEGDFLVSSCLVDRTLRETGPEWLREHLESYIDQTRKWIGAAEGHTFVLWKKVDAVKSKLGVRPPVGRFSPNREPAKVNALAARTALAIARHMRREGEPVDAVLLIRDMDDQPERSAGLRQARDEVAVTEPSMPVVVGAANPELEAWILAGFEPSSDAERERFASVRSELGFDPRSRAAELTAKHDDDKRSSKRVLKALTKEDMERRERCYRTTPLAVLAERGEATGLRAFLDEVASEILPLFTGAPSP